MANEEKRDARSDNERGDPGAHVPEAAHRGHTDHQMDRDVTPADTGPASLGGRPGRGILTVEWSSDGNIHDARGSWFPEAHSAADLEPLREAIRDDRTLVYEGPAIDGATVGREREDHTTVRREVRIVDVREYRDLDDEARTLVSFELPAGDNVNDVPKQYTRSEFLELDLEEMAAITGLEAPTSGDPEAERKYREHAWQSYELDLEHRDEWGTARQGTPLPRGE